MKTSELTRSLLSSNKDAGLRDKTFIANALSQTLGQQPKKSLQEPLE
ncbi:unnamed protein product [Acidithrix sp. C25]|jgi:hypothetical protein|nr:unnamed protein product [Acidithrix sp. C25]